MEQMEVHIDDDEVEEVKDTQIIEIISSNKRGIIACVFSSILLFIILGMSLGINIHHYSSSEDNQQNCVTNLNDFRIWDYILGRRY